MSDWQIETDEQKMFRETAKSFVDKEIRPNVVAWEKQGFTPKELWRKCGEQGFLGLNYPEHVGGQGCDYSFPFIWNEEVAKCGSLGVAMGLAVQSDMATPALVYHGNEFLQEHYLKPAIRGEKVCSIAVTEPGGGSDVASLKSTGRLDGNEWIINGQKTFITNGTQADFLTFLARTNDSKGHNCFSLFVIPTDTPGVQRGKTLDKICFQSSDTVEFFLEDVRLDPKFLVGQEGKGFIYQMQQFQRERLVGVAMSLGCMERSYELTKQYVFERKAFGQALKDFQVTQHKMAQMISEITALKSMASQCVNMVSENKDVTKYVSMLKLLSAQTQVRVLDECAQLFGGYGLMTEYEVARYFRDAKLLSIGAGTNEVMKEIIVKYEGLR